MGQCVNSKHPEVTTLAGELNAHPAVVAAQIGIWQEQNNTYDRFPSALELNKSKIESDVKSKLNSDLDFKNKLENLYSKGATYQDYIEHRNISFLELGSEEDLDHFENKYNENSTFDNSKVDPITEQEYKSYSKIGSLEDFVTYKQTPLYEEGRVKKGVSKINYFKAFLKHQTNNVESRLDKVLTKYPDLQDSKSLILNNSDESVLKPQELNILKTSVDNKSIFFNTNQDITTPSEVIGRMLSKGVLNNSDESSDILKRLLAVTHNSKTKIKIVKKESDKKLFNSNTLMIYDRINDDILIKPSVFEEYSTETLISTLLHELTHSVTVNKLANPQTFEEKTFNKFIEDTFTVYKNLGLTLNNNGSIAYGFTNKYEFVAEIYSNPEFRKELQSHDRSLIQRFLDSIRRILGLSKTDANSKFINSTVLFNTVENEINDGNQNFSSLVGSRFFAKEIHDEGSLDNKLQKLIQTQLNNVDQILRRSRANNKGNDKKNSSNEEFIKNTEDLYSHLESALNADYIKGVNHYVDFMTSQIEKATSFLNKLKSGEDANISLDTLKRLDSYIAASNLTHNIREVLTDARINTLPSEIKETTIQILNKLDQYSGIQSTLISTIHNIKVDVIKKELNKPFFVNEAIQKFKDSIRKDYVKNSGITLKNWLNEQVQTRKDEVDAFVEREINDIIETVTVDIDLFDKALMSTIKTKSNLLQLVQKVISKMKTTLDKILADYDFKLKGLYDKIVGKGVYDPSKMISEDKNGVKFVKGPYSMEVYNYYKYTVAEIADRAYNKYQELANKGLSEQQIKGHPEYVKLHQERRLALSKYTIPKDGKLIIDPKYKVKLTEKEQLLYDEFKKVATDGASSFGNYNSLIQDYYGAEFIKLPYKTLTNIERIALNKVNAKDYLKHKKSELLDWKMDDMEQYTAMYDALGNKIFNIPVMFRNTAKPGTPEFERAIKEQSIDVFTLLRAEKHNVENFKIKSENEMILNTLVDISGNKKYYKSEGAGTLVRNLFGNHVNTVMFDGKNSKTYERMQEVVQQSLYSVFREQGFKVGSTDVNKIVQNLNKHTSLLGMTANYFNAPVNVMNGEFQMLLARFAGDLDKNTLRSAHSEYIKDMPEIIKDLGRNVKESKVNQLNLLLDMFGGLTHSQNDFIKNNILKNITDPHTLQVLQEGGEHMLHSVLAIAISKTIKVYNENGKAVDKLGNVSTSPKTDANLYDMLKFENKQLSFDTSKFKHTNVSMNVDFEIEGLTAVRLYVKNHIENLYGQYDINFANSIQLNWWGQLLIMYKKYLVPLGLHRFRGGMKSAFGDLKNNPHYNTSAQAYEEGFYISSIKVFRKMFLSTNNGLAGVLDNLKLEMLKKNWNELSELEQKNIKKTLFEIGVLIMITNILVPMMAGLASGEDDDDIIWYYAMLSRRLEQELSQFVDITEAYNITENPVASLNIIETYIDTLKFAATPWTWGSQTQDGDYRVLNSLEKLTVPSAWRTNKTAKGIFESSINKAYVPVKEGVFYEAFDNE